MEEESSEDMKNSSEKIAQFLVPSSKTEQGPNHQIETNISTAGKKSFVIEMTDRPIEDTLKLKFEKAWSDFVQFLGHGEKPSVQEYQTYFDQLKSNKNSKPVAVWTVFNRLQQCHHRYYKEDLRNIPELMELSKKLRNPDPVEQCYFQQSQIDQFLLLNFPENDLKYWLCRKAFAIISMFGALNCQSVKKIKMQDLTFHQQNGIYVKVSDCKQILVPNSNIPNSNLSYSEILKNYHETVIQDTKQTKGPLFRHFFKSSRRFTRISMGIAVFQKISSEVALSLGLGEPDRFGENSFNIQIPVQDFIQN